MKYFIAFSLFLLTALNGSSQIGGRYTYEFLNLSSSPRVGAMGGKLISHPGEDLSLVYYNPALLSKSMQNYLTLNYIDYLAGIKYGYVSYSHPFKENLNIAYGIQYLNYGSFTGADETGTITGTFKAAEYALNIAVSMPLDSFFTIGADIRPILSNLESYTSYGISSDLGVHYYNPGLLSHFALVFRNIGSQLKSYAGQMEPLPFEIQFGYTQFLRYAPFNVSITAHHLETWDMSVVRDETNNSSVMSYEDPEKTRSLDKFANNLMRHLVFGIEFTPFKNFYFRLGYNYQRRQELKISTRPATAGISWGFGFSIKSFQFSYGRATYHLAGASDHFSISTNLRYFYSKK